MTSIQPSPAQLHTSGMGAIGIPRAESPRAAPVYDVPYGSVQLAGPSASGIPGFDLATGFSGEAEYDGVDEDDDEEGEGEAGEEDDDSSEDGSSKPKGGSRKGGGNGRSNKGKKAKTEAKGEKDAKTGRRKIKIEFIEDDARRHITFSKRKAGIMKKAYELATLTGTQVLLLVVSQTGLVYTFTTPKLQALVTQAEGRNLIQACLNAPDPAADQGDGSEGTRSPGEDQDSQDEQSRPGSSASASMRGKMRPAKAGEIMTGPNTNFKKRPRDNSASKVSSISHVGEGDDGANKRSRGRPRKDTGASVAGSLEGDATQKRRRTGSKSAGSSAMDSNSSTSVSSSGASHVGHLPGVMENSSSLGTKFGDPLISPSLRGDHLQMMQNPYGQQNANYAYNPMAYFPPGSDPAHQSGLGYSTGGQQHQHQQQQHQHHHHHQHNHQHAANHVSSMAGGGDGAMPWNGGMSPQNATQPLYAMSPTSGTDRATAYAGYGVSQPPAPYASHHQYSHMMPVQESSSQEQRW